MNKLYNNIVYGCMTLFFFFSMWASVNLFVKQIITTGTLWISAGIAVFFFFYIVYLRKQIFARNRLEAKKLVTVLLHFV